MRKVLFALLIVPVGLVAGCMADAQVGYTQPAVMVQPAVVVAQPQPMVVEAGYQPPPGPEPVLVEVNPGVQVVQDYDYPVFFSGGLYWRNDGGVWMSSRWHTGGWVRNDGVPVGVRGISHPEGYVHYRAGVTVHEGGGVREGGVIREGGTVREGGVVREGVTVHEGGGAVVHEGGVVREGGSVHEGATIHEGATVHEGGGATVHEGGAFHEGATVHEGGNVGVQGGAHVEAGAAHGNQMAPQKPAQAASHPAPPSRPPPQKPKKK